MKTAKLLALVSALAALASSCGTAKRTDPRPFFAPGSSYRLTVSVGGLTARAELEIGADHESLAFEEGFVKRFDGDGETDVLNGISIPLAGHSAFFELAEAVRAIAGGTAGFAETRNDDGTLTLVFGAEGEAKPFRISFDGGMTRPLRIETQSLSAAFDEPG